MCSKSAGLTCPGLPGPRSRAGPGARLRLLPQGPRTEGSSRGPHPGELGRSCPWGQPRSQKGPSHVGVKSAARDSQQGHLRAPGSPAESPTPLLPKLPARKVSGLTTKCDVGRCHATRVTWLSHGPYATLKAAGAGAGRRLGTGTRSEPPSGGLSLQRDPGRLLPGAPVCPRGAPTRSGGRPPPRSRTRLSEPRGPRTPSSRGIRMAPSEEQFSRQVFGRKTNERCPTAREDDAGFKCRVSTQRHGHGGSRARRLARPSRPLGPP